jgi:hypothetical protein
VPNGWRGTISTFTLNFIVNLRCLFVIVSAQLKFLHQKLNKTFEVKFVTLSKKLSCKAPNFLIHGLGGRKVYQKKKKKVGVVILKI